MLNDIKIKLDIDGNTLKQLLIFATLLLTITICSGLQLHNIAQAQVFDTALKAGVPNNSSEALGQTILPGVNAKNVETQGCWWLKNYEPNSLTDNDPKLMELVTKISNYMESNETNVFKTSYGQCYINPMNDTIFILLKENNPSIDSSASLLLQPDPSIHVVYRTCNYTYDELESIVQEVSSSTSSLEAAGVNVAGIGISENATVLVNLTEVTPSSVSTLLDKIPVNIPRDCLVIRRGDIPQTTGADLTPTPQQSYPPTLAKNSTEPALTVAALTQPDFQIVDVKVAPDVYANFPNAYATVKVEVTVKTYAFNTSLPVLINGNETNVSVNISVPVSLALGEEKTFNTTAELWSGQPTLVASHIDYTISVGGVEKIVAVHPDRTSLLIFGIIIPIVIVIAYFAWNRTCK